MLNKFIFSVNLFHKVHHTSLSYILILSCYLHLCLPSENFPKSLRTINFNKLLFSPLMLHGHSSRYFDFIFLWICSGERTSDEAPYYAISPTFWSLAPTRARQHWSSKLYVKGEGGNYVLGLCLTKCSYSPYDYVVSNSGMINEWWIWHGAAVAYSKY